MTGKILEIADRARQQGDVEIVLADLELQRLLRSGYTPESIYNSFAITHRRHPKWNNLVQFIFTEKSNMTLKLCQQARGIILDENSGWSVVCRGFDKFFMYGERIGPTKEADWIFNWSSARAYDKMDGLYVMAYYYGGQWNIATTFTPDGSEVVGWTGDTDVTKLFWRIVKFSHLGEIFSDCTKLRNFTLMFELCTILTRVVCLYDKPHIYLTGMRHVASSVEQSAGAANLFIGEHKHIEARFELPAERANASSYSHIFSQLQGYDPLHTEGVVVVDSDWKRLKVKNPKWLELNRIRAWCSREAFLEHIRAGKAAEARADVHSLRNLSILQEYDDLVVAYSIFVGELSEQVVNMPVGDRKTTVEWIRKNSSWPPYHLSRMEGSTTSPGDFLAGVPIQKLTNLLVAAYLPESKG